MFEFPALFGNIKHVDSYELPASLIIIKNETINSNCSIEKSRLVVFYDNQVVLSTLG